MSIPGSYYIIEVSKADRLAPGKTREPLNPSDTSNLRRNKEGTQFVINSTETIPGANYVNKFASRADMIAYINNIPNGTNIEYKNIKLATIASLFGICFL